MDLDTSAGENDRAAYILYVTEREATRRSDFGCFLAFEWFKMVVAFRLDEDCYQYDAVKGF